MLDDLLPNPFDKMRREMLQSIRTLWVLYTGVIILAWAVLPWRLGWLHGVGECLWLTFWWAWGPGWYSFAKWLKKNGAMNG